MEQQLLDLKRSTGASSEAGVCSGWTGQTYDDLPEAVWRIQSDGRQILMTKNTMVNNANRKNAENTFNELLSMGVIPIVNENDSISTYELQSLEKFGDNDTLSAVVAALIGADLLILMSDIDGLFTDDPNTNPDAKFIDTVETLDDELLNMGKCSSGSKVGTGGMATKLTAARIATAAGTDMVIANGGDFHNIHRIVEGDPCGTLFVGKKKEEFS